MASTHLTRTPSSTSNQKTFCTSFWIKRSQLGTAQMILYKDEDATAPNEYFMAAYFDANDRLYAGRNQLGSVLEIITSRKFRDTNAWYNIVIAWDTTQATASNRVKVYVNGVQETSFDSANYPSQNANLEFNLSGKVHRIGAGNDAAGSFFSGYLSHFHFIDGTTYDASAFGEFDANGVWKIKTNVSVNYGTNGFFILKDGNSVTDQSGNGNNWTVAGGTLTNTEDNPSNVFATLNPLDKGYTGAIVLANGNTTTQVSSGAGDYGLRSTLGVSAGKYYWECKIASGNTLNVGDIDARLVFSMTDNTPTADFYGVQRYNDSATNLYDDGTFVSQNTAMWGGITSSDIISFAVDLDNGKIFLAKNGTYKDQSGNTGDPVAGTNPTFTISDTTKTYGFYTELRANDANGTIMNFGNGYFGTTAVASAGTNASGNGIFEYDVPTGYTALSTKGLNL